MNPALRILPPDQRKRLLVKEAMLRAAGDWGPWEVLDLATKPRGAGWLRECTQAYRNDVFCALVRPLPGGEIHIAVSSLSGIRPTFHEMQRIKNTIAGTEATAVEVYPPQSELVDEADMFHIWTVPSLPFSLKDGRAG